MTGAVIDTGQGQGHHSRPGPATPEKQLAQAAQRSADTPADGDRDVSWVVATALVLTVSTTAAVVVPALRHWFLVPVTMSGVLIVPDAVHWGRRRLDTFDPQAMLGLIGTHFFYASPMLHVLLDHWAKYVQGSDDWRSALGQMAMLNVLGLLVYRATMAPRIRPSGAPLPQSDIARLCKLTAALAVLGALGFAILVRSLGGPASYLQIMADERQQLIGLGPALLIAKTFPTAVLVLVLIRFRAFLRKRSVALLLILPMYVVTEFFVGGLGGSRSHTVWSLIIGVGLCHVVVRRVRRRTLALLMLLLIAFMYFYGFYKDDGTQAINALSGGATLSDLSSQTGRDLPGVLLSDLGRADIQALVLERQREGNAPLRYGATYVGDLRFLVPDAAGLRRIPDKVEAGTEMLYGRKSFTPDFQATLVYGLAGEAILNFGAAGAVLCFLPLGLVMRRVTSFYRRCLLTPDSLGVRLLAPSLSLGATLILSSDLDNIAWFFLNYVAILALLAVCSRRSRRTGQNTKKPLSAHASGDGESTQPSLNSRDTANYG